MKINLNNSNKETIIDDEDVGVISKHSWYINNCGYVISTEGISLHRLVLGITKKNQHIDHINRDKLDNRKINLRICMPWQNAHNIPKKKNNTSGYKGVFRNGEKWISKIMVRGNRIYLGTFDTKEKAYEAYLIESQNT